MLDRNIWKMEEPVLPDAMQSDVKLKREFVTEVLRLTNNESFVDQTTCQHSVFDIHGE
jgi:hypothetical protein